MENQKKKKCLYKEHKEIDAISYCAECKIYMCNKCSNHHQGYENHHQFNLDKERDDNQIFIDICKEENHPLKLEYFCKNHNILCCAACIAKMEGKGNGKHKDCDIYFIENIKDEKKNKLKDNIKYLEDLSKNIENSINELRVIFEKINKNKEELKLKVQKIFTKIRNALNEREDELLLEVDNQYNDIFCNEDIIKNSEKLPNTIKISLEKGKLINNEWKDINNLSSIINDCINIENNIKYINIINDNVKKCNVNNSTKIEFIPEDESINTFIQNIKNFGKIYNMFNFICDSKILKNKDDLNKFYQLISNHIKITSIKLIYCLTKDGNEFSSFVNKINNKSNLIFIYLTGNKRKFGVYIKTKLENICSDKYYKDENAFVFSLDNIKIYKVLIPEYAIRFYRGYPILIGNNAQSNGFYKNGNIIYDDGLLANPKIYDFQKKGELTEGLNQITEFEVLEINYI